jgi:uncharacterized membrane protein YbhN (UPF0104 family)
MNTQPGQNLAQPPDSKSGAGVTVLRIALTVVLMTLILNKVGFSNLLERFRQVNPWFVVGAAAISVLFTALKSFKWFFLLRRVVGTGTYKEAARTYLIGLGLAAVTPGRIGELGRAYYLRAGDRVFSAGIVAVDRLLDLVCVFALACVGGFTLVGGGLGWVCLGVAVVTLAVLYWPDRPVQLAVTVLQKIPIARRLEALPQGFRSVTRPTLTITLLLTFLYYGLVILEYYILLSGFEQVRLGAVLLVAPLVIMTNAFQVTIGGLGVREGASVLLFSLFGVSEEAAVNATFLITLFNVLVPGLVGAALSARHQR